jgi:hypothetical protein
MRRARGSVKRATDVCRTDRPESGRSGTSALGPGCAKTLKSAACFVGAGMFKLGRPPQGLQKLSFEATIFNLVDHQVAPTNQVRCPNLRSAADSQT